MIKIFVGSESYLIRRGLNKALGGREDIEEFDSLSPAVFDAARQLSLFGDKRILLVRLDELGASEELLKYMKKPSNSADLFITAKKIDKRSSVYRYLNGKEELVLCEKLSESALQKCVLVFLKENQMRMKDSAYRMFVERSDYFTADEVTLDTIYLYLKQMKFLASDITEKEVAEIVPESSNQKSFDLVKLLLDKDVSKLFVYAHKLVENGENIIGMMSLLLRQMRLGYKACLMKGQPVGTISKELGVQSFQFEKMLKYDAKVMEDAIEILQDGINSIKSGQAGQRVIFFSSLGKLVTAVGVR